MNQQIQLVIKLPDSYTNSYLGIIHHIKIAKKRIQGGFFSLSFDLIKSEFMSNIFQCQPVTNRIGYSNIPKNPVALINILGNNEDKSMLDYCKNIVISPDIDFANITASSWKVLTLQELLDERICIILELKCEYFHEINSIKMPFYFPNYHSLRYFITNYKSTYNSQYDEEIIQSVMISKSLNKVTILTHDRVHFRKIYKQMKDQELLKSIPFTKPKAITENISVEIILKIASRTNYYMKFKDKNDWYEWRLT